MGAAPLHILLWLSHFFSHALSCPARHGRRAGESAAMQPQAGGQPSGGGRASFSRPATRLRPDSVRTRDNDVTAGMRAVPDTPVRVISHATVVMGTCADGDNDGPPHRPYHGAPIRRAYVARGHCEQGNRAQEQMFDFHGNRVSSQWDEAAEKKFSAECPKGRDFHFRLLPPFSPYPSQSPSLP